MNRKAAIRVLLLSTSYPSNRFDWRGVFMRHLVGALASRLDLHLSVWAPPGELPENATAATTPADSDWLARLMAAGGISHLMRAGGVRALLAPIKLMRMIGSVYHRHKEVDIYHINWLQCAIPLPANGKPALITVLGNDLKLLRFPFVRLLLRRMMKHRRIAICPNAEWMLAPLQETFGDVADVIPVLFGIDLTWFGVQRRDSEIPRRWLAVSRLTIDKLGPLFEWSQAVFSDGARELHLFGPMQESIRIPSWVHYHGAATPEELAIEWFPSACGLITLSRHAEGRPQVMLEAMAAGLPIIASDTPAHAGIVKDRHTGILCHSPESYRLAIEALEDDSTNRRYGHTARRWVRQEVGTWDDCAQRYAQIYQNLLGDNIA